MRSIHVSRGRNRTPGYKDQGGQFDRVNVEHAPTVCLRVRCFPVRLILRTPGARRWLTRTGERPCAAPGARLAYVGSATASDPRLRTSTTMEFSTLETVFEILAKQPVLFLFLLVGIGMAFGHIKIRGIGLGAAAVLFFAIVIAAWAQSYGVELRVTPQLGTLGLTLFTFAIGINSGASFFHNLKTAIGPILTMVALYAVAAIGGLYVGKALGMEVPLIAGTFAGALTNTPALAAAGDASGNAPMATVGYSIAYLFGVIGMLAASMAALSYGKNDKDAPSPCRTARSASNARTTPSWATSTRGSARRSPSPACGAGRPARSHAPRCPTRWTRATS